ncbi:MAG: nucleoside deaminase [Bacteroidales bacterium]|nr:nucleoside deaminase [Bacteroidales bacterium]MDZ4204967.1 nucleoside deaminase [Bacteroidales bacterium]
MNEYRIEFMDEALRLAKANVNSGKGGPFGAVVVKDGRIIARGVNLVTSNNDPTAHAELIAIRNACAQLEWFELTDCEIYSSCEPCPMCLGAIYWARPAALYFAATRLEAAEAGFDDAMIYGEICTHVEGRKIPTMHVRHKLAASPFIEWKTNGNKIPY